MKQAIILFDLILLICVTFHLACSKEYSCEKCRINDKPPIANAGSDQDIKLPTDTVLLDGSGSSDPDGTINKWMWAKISGPSSFNMINASAVKTAVTKLSVGTYLFELTVTDNVGLSAKDSVRIEVDPNRVANLPPVAKAGTDTTITLPASTANLDGSGSSDPEKDINSYAWTKISGPSTLSILNENSVKTKVTNLVQGTYEFELKVTDTAGLYARDTVQVTVKPSSCDPSTRPLVTVQLVPVTNIPIGNVGPYGYNPFDTRDYCSNGTKVFFLALDVDTNQDDTLGRAVHINIYDLVTQTWTFSSSYMIANRGEIQMIASGGKVFLAGGYLVDGLGAHYTLPDVDIYDVSTDTWTTSYLGVGRNHLVAAATNDKVFFAGGRYKPDPFNGSDAFLSYNAVDIYDLATNTWSSSPLSLARDDLSIVTVDGKTFFGGGVFEKFEPPSLSDPSSVSFLDRIDIYDDISGTRLTSSLTEPKAGMGGAVVGYNIFWAGGYNSQGLTANVEIRNINTGNISTACLFQPNAHESALEDNNQVIFFTGEGTVKNKFDIYDVTTNSWSIGTLNQSMVGTLISVNNVIYVIGTIAGSNTSQIWKLMF